MIFLAPFFCLLPDITIKIFSNWWARTPIDWQLKEIADSKMINAVKDKDKNAKYRVRMMEALRLHAEYRKEHELEYGLEEYGIEKIIEMHLGSGSPKAKTPKAAGGSPGKDGPGAYNFDLDADYDLEKAAAAQEYGEEEEVEGKLYKK